MTMVQRYRRLSWEHLVISWELWLIECRCPQKCPPNWLSFVILNLYVLWRDFAIGLWIKFAMKLRSVDLILVTYWRRWSCVLDSKSDQCDCGVEVILVIYYCYYYIVAHFKNEISTYQTKGARNRLKNPFWQRFLNFK